MRKKQKTKEKQCSVCTSLKVVSLILWHFKSVPDSLHEIPLRFAHTDNNTFAKLHGKNSADLLHKALSCHSWKQPSSESSCFHLDINVKSVYFIPGFLLCLCLIDWSLSDPLWLVSHQFPKSERGLCNWTVIRFHCGTKAAGVWLKCRDTSFGEKRETTWLCYGAFRKHKDATGEIFTVQS